MNAHLDFCWGQGDLKERALVRDLRDRHPALFNAVQKAMPLKASCSRAERSFTTGTR